MTQFEDRTERRSALVLEAMVLHTPMLAKVAAESNGRKLFAASTCETAAKILIGYYEKHHKAPRRAFAQLVHSWGEDHPDREDDYKLLERLARAIGDDYDLRAEEINAEYALDLANQLFSDVALREAIDKADECRRRGDYDRAFQFLTEARKVELGENSKGRLLSDDSEIETIFAQGAKPLVTYEHALGQLFGDALARECFVAFMAPEKTGKSYMLLDLAFQAMRQRKRVAFFEAGDMTKTQIGLRFFAHMAEHPYRSTNDDLSWPCIVKYPTSLGPPGQGEEMATVVRDELVFKNPLNARIAKEARDRFRRETLKSWKDYIYSSCHPNLSLSVSKIRSILQQWEMDGWVPDVVIVDFADLLADPPGKRDSRDNIYRNWLLLRGLASERHCLVATATQANAESYKKGTALAPWNFSDDKRKYGTVTAIFGVCNTPDEKDAGLVRMNCLFRREGESNWRKVVHVARCLPFSMAHVLSTW